jgi:hypothetical protein
MNQRFEDLTIETTEDENGQFIILSQDDGSNKGGVAIHHIHLRYLAEQFGLTETSTQQANKTIATLERRLLARRDRMESLHDYLVNHSDHKHADLTFEMTYATATLDIADAFCADFDTTASVSTMESGNVATPSGQVANARKSPKAKLCQLAIDL